MYYTLNVGELIRILSHWTPDTPVLVETPDRTLQLGNAAEYDGMNLKLLEYEGNN